MFRKFQNVRQAITGCNMVKSSSPNASSTWLVFLCPRTHTSPLTCHNYASSILAVWISCHVIVVLMFRKPQEEWRSRWIPTIRLRYFLTSKILLQVMYRYVRMIFVVKCLTVTRFFIACAVLWWKSMILERSSVPNTEANYMKEQNWSILQGSSSSCVAILKKHSNSWWDKHIVFTKDITLSCGYKYPIMHACILLLLQVNDENVEHMSTAEVIDLLRKIRGTIGITVLRKSGTNVQVSWSLVEKN
jgi:hypothetical protein